jgi:hypothetical protein
MLEILQFVFSSLWVFVGTTILLSIAVKGAVCIVALIVAGVRGGNVNIS